MGIRLYRAAVIVLLTACLSWRICASAPSGPPDARPAPAVAAILEAFDRYPIVALGEAHGLEEEREFIGTLLHDPRFPGKVNDIVVEFGNARYQAVIDRYLAGEEVPALELQRVWRDHTGPGPWLSSAYPKYFAAFREANKSLPPARRFRVLLGDPPIDWSAIHSQQDFGRFLAQRDAHFTRVVEEQVLAKGRKALLIIGSAHLLRKGMLGPIEVGPRTFTGPPPGAAKGDAPGGNFFGPAPAGGPGPQLRPDAVNVARAIDRDYPGKLFIVLPHDGLGEGSARIQEQFKEWPIPSLALLKGTRPGAVAANQITPRPRLVKMFKDGKVMDPPKADPSTGPRLEEIADAFLYLGPRETLTLAPEAEVSEDTAFIAEIKRRRELTGARPSPADAARKQSRRFIDQ
jgi:hypothetical protein